jgi:hypothetical protein
MSPSRSARFSPGEHVAGHRAAQHGAEQRVTVDQERGLQGLQAADPQGVPGPRADPAQVHGADSDQRRGRRLGIGGLRHLPHDPDGHLAVGELNATLAAG